MRITTILTAAAGALMITAGTALAQSSNPWQAAADAFAQQYQRQAAKEYAEENAYPGPSRFHESLRQATQAATEALERENRQRIERGLREMEERRQYVEMMQRLNSAPRRAPAVETLPTYSQPVTPRQPAVPAPAQKYGCGPFVRGVCEIAR